MVIYRVFTDTKNYNEKVYAEYANERRAKEVLSRKGWNMEVIVK